MGYDLQYQIKDQTQQRKQMNIQYQYKVVLAGDSSVGKSSLLKRYADDSFEESYLATVGVDFKFKMLKVDGSNAKLQIWDTAGQERFRTITSAYYKNAQGVILVYDLKIGKTLEDLESYWLVQLKKYGEEKVQTIILGNKSDMLTEEEKEAAEKNHQQFLQKFNLPGFLVSAKTGEGVTEAFEQITRRCINMFGDMRKDIAHNKTVIDDIRKKKAEFQLHAGSEISPNKKKCC